MIRRTLAIGAVLWAGLACGAYAQNANANVGVGASVGLVDDITTDFSSGSFKHSSVAVPLIKERVGYITVGASYLFWEGWFTSGIFGGIGGYHISPDAVPPPFTEFADQKQTVFGWHFGTEAIFRVFRNTGIVLRLTYHNVSATPHRQFLNANTGAVIRF